MQQQAQRNQSEKAHNFKLPYCPRSQFHTTKHNIVTIPIELVPTSNNKSNATKVKKHITLNCPIAQKLEKWKI